MWYKLSNPTLLVYTKTKVRNLSFQDYVPCQSLLSIVFSFSLFFFLLYFRTFIEDVFFCYEKETETIDDLLYFLNA